MRRSLSLLVALSFPGLALPACSALGLDHLPQADCMQGSGGVHGDDFCASLADRIPPGACLTWQCNPDTRHCEQMPTDADHDGAPSMMCAMGATPDCDDADMHNHPGGTETCNGVDENCDGIPDDGAIVGSEMMSSLTTLMGMPTQVALAYQPDSDEAYLLTRTAIAFRGTTITSTAAPADLAFAQPPGTPIAVSDANGAISALGSQRYAFAMRRFDSVADCQQWSVFPIHSGNGTVSLRAIDETLVPACAAGAPQRLTAPAIAGHPVSAASSSDLVLLAWLTGADDIPGDRACGAAPSRTVMVGGALFNDRTPSGNRVSTEVRMLGDSVGDGPPVVLALDDAFLVAYPRADMTIAVHLVTVSVDGTTTVHVAASAPVTPDYAEPAGTMVPQNVVLARGGTASGATSVALGYTAGCGGNNAITVRMLTRSGSTVTGSSSPATNLGAGPARRRLSIAYQPRSDDWVLGWRSGTGLSVQRLMREGAPEGDSFALTASTTVNTFILEPLATGPLYRAVVVDGTAVNQVTFGCAP